MPAANVPPHLESIILAGLVPVPCPAAGLRRRVELPASGEVKGYVTAFLERKVVIRNFVTGIELVEDEAVLA